MIILRFTLTVFVVYVWLLHLATTSDRNAQDPDRLASATTARTPNLTGDDLIDPSIEGATWTVLDDNQLTRLLEASAPPNGPDRLH